MMLLGSVVWFISICPAFAIFNDITDFRWSIEVQHLKDDFNFYPGPLSLLNRPIKSVGEIDIPSFPQDWTNQAAGLDHRATPHVAEVKIVNKTGSASDIALRSLIGLGILPIAKVFYLSPTGNNLDSGSSILKIRGMVSDHKLIGTKHVPCLVYPIPINDQNTMVHFTLPIFSFGDISLRPFRKVLHLSNLRGNDGGKNIAVSPMRNRDWFPEMSINALVMACAVSEDHFLISTDEFENILNVSLGGLQKAANKCPNADGAVIPFQKAILHLSKKGSRFFNFSTDQRWIPTESSPAFVNDSVCLRRADVSPPSYFKELLVASSKRFLFIANSTGLSSMKELVDFDGRRVCEVAQLAENECEIIDHTFDPAFCCNIYILLKNLVSSIYILLEYAGEAFDGNWNILLRVSNILPRLEENTDRLVFVSPAVNYTGRQFKINGISTLTKPDGTLYIWGDALLVFDFRSGILAWIPSFIPSADDAIAQFSSANEKGMYAMFSKKGAVWIGSAYPFEKHYSQLLKLILELSDEYLAIFFDSLDTLYGVAANAIGDGYSFARKEIKNDTFSSTFCMRTYNCTRLFLKCSAESSAFHINHTKYSRARHFSVRPPRLMPKAKRSNLLHPLYNMTSLLTYFTVMERFFTGQKIGVARWWRDDRIDLRTKELKDWWYTQDASLEKFRKYLAAADLLPNQPLMYLEKRQYLQEFIHPPGKYDTWDTSFCRLPAIIYLDKNQEFRFQVVIEHALSATHLDFHSLLLVAISSDNSVLDVTTTRHPETMNVLYDVIFTGKAMAHRSPGEFLKTISVTLYPLNSPEDASGEACCSGIAEEMAFGQDVLVKVGCPPGRRLVFDTRRSSEILFDRGRTEDFECLHEVEDNVPCFTTSEFVAAFYIEDMVTGEQMPFEGNYTLQVVAGGVGHAEHFTQYSEEEVKSFNYSPGDSKSLLSLIWSVLLESSSVGMRDEATGKLIFDAKNPASIVFECRISSPCGNIPLWTFHPGEFYLDIEVSNMGVDSSTNCDYTTRFMIHLIGIELSHMIHLNIMVVTLSILTMSAMMYYLCKFAGGYKMLRTCLGKRDDYFGSDTESERSELQKPNPEILNMRRLTIGALPANVQGAGARRTSILTQTLMVNAERGKRNSIGNPNMLRARGSVSKGSTRKLD